MGRFWAAGGSSRPEPGRLWHLRQYLQGCCHSWQCIYTWPITLIPVGPLRVPSESLIDITNDSDVTEHNSVWTCIPLLYSIKPKRWVPHMNFVHTCTIMHRYHVFIQRRGICKLYGAPGRAAYSLKNKHYRMIYLSLPDAQAATIECYFPQCAHTFWWLVYLFFVPRCRLCSCE